MNGPSVPTRPRRLLTFSRDRYGLSNGASLIGLGFGTLFTASGCLVLYVLCRTSLELMGLIPQGFVVPGQSVLSYVMGFGAMLLIGGGHLFGGTMCLWTLRAHFDRSRGTVVVRSGWLGLWAVREHLAHFVRVSVILDERNWWMVPDYKIALERSDGSFLVVGTVTMSPELAKDVAAEVNGFVGPVLAS